MEYGAHLPLIDVGRGAPTLGGLRAYAQAASACGLRFLCANDHLLFARPWLDGPTALATTLAESDDLTLATTVALPVLRGPVQTAKTLAGNFVEERMLITISALRIRASKPSSDPGSVSKYTDGVLSRHLRNEGLEPMTTG